MFPSCSFPSCCSLSSSFSLPLSPLFSFFLSLSSFSSSSSSLHSHSCYSSSLLCPCAPCRLCPSLSSSPCLSPFPSFRSPCLFPCRSFLSACVPSPFSLSPHVPCPS